MSNENEAFMEELSLFRKYAYEFGQSHDIDTYELMMKCQQNLHALYEAKADSAQEVAELKATIEELRYMQGINTDYATAELQAHINVLREALEIARDYQFDAVSEFHSAFKGYKAEKHKRYDDDLANTEKALAKTPAQSLQAFENDVIERCAKVCESTHRGWVTKDAADEIRALKGAAHEK